MTDQTSTALIGGDREHEKCDGCEQWDDHPKVHYGQDRVEPETLRVLFKAPVYHHDCTPAHIRREILGEGSVHATATEATRAAFDGADKGLRGGKLLAHIQTVHEKAAAAAEKE